MDVTIEAIKFNHDPNFATADALTIRQNKDTDVCVPEWKRGNGRTPITSAVAYARSQGNALTIAVRLRRFNKTVQSVEVSAESKSFLGNVAKDKIDFPSDKDVSDFKIFKLTGASINSVNVEKSNVSLTWTLKGSGAPFKETTTHLMYTLLDLPRSPWGPQDSEDDYEVPWVDVIDRACTWAPGAKDRIEVASKITKEIYELGKSGKLIFAEGESYPHLVLNGTDRFDCTRFLKHLEEGRGPLKVNCTDCAILVSSFANILGCDLYQSQMSLRFYTNHNRLIGFRNEAKTEFNYHEVAWEYDCTPATRLFDACLEVDGDEFPAGGDFDSLLPVNIPFGNQHSGGYHFRLVAARELCNALPGTKIRRRIARRKLLRHRVNRQLERLLKEEFDFDSWEKIPAPDGVFRDPIERIGEGFSPVGWRLDRVKVFKEEFDTLQVTEAFWQGTENPNTTLRVLTYRCTSVPDARAFVLSLLGEFQSRDMRRAITFEKEGEVVKIGDLAFSGPKGRVLLFARSNLVVFVQNAADTPGPVSSFAHASDQRILTMLGADETGRAHEIRSDNSLEKEKTSMLINLIDSKWSSIRPQATAIPVDMRHDGVFTIKKYDQVKGDVEGKYYDVKVHKEVDFNGFIRFNGTTHIFVLVHVVPDRDFKRIYEGQIVSDDRTVAIIAGRWRNTRAVTLDASEEGRDLIDLTGQDEGVWVATKP